MTLYSNMELIFIANLTFGTFLFGLSSKPYLQELGITHLNGDCVLEDHC